MEKSVFWIDRTSETDNVIVITEAAILVGSCDEETYDSVQQQLSSGKSVVEVLGSDSPMSIPFSQIQRITSRSTDNDVSIDFKGMKEIENKLVFFDGVDSKQAFVAALDGVMPEHMVKSEYKQSALGAALSPLLSLALSITAIYLFINKFKWPTLVVGGLWAMISTYMLLSRLKSPPTVTRWAVGGRYVRKAWAGLKTATSYIVLAGFIAVGHSSLPDAWGSKALYEQMWHETLSADSVATLVERGADINYQGEYGDSALDLAMDWGYYDVAIALIEAGADLDQQSSYEMTPLEYAVSYDLDTSIVEALLQNGASLDFEIDGMSPAEFARENAYDDLGALLAAHGGR